MTRHVMPTAKLWAARAIMVLIVFPLALIWGFAEEFVHAGKMGWQNAKMSWASVKDLWADPWLGL